MARLLVTLSIVFLLVVPVIDQLACPNCGPAVQTTAAANPVPHPEDDFVPQDGFEEASTSPYQDVVHVHFCLLHSTSLALGQSDVLDLQVHAARVFSSSVRFDDLNSSDFFHPPLSC